MQFVRGKTSTSDKMSPSLKCQSNDHVRCFMLGSRGKAKSGKLLRWWSSFQLSGLHCIPKTRKSKIANRTTDNHKLVPGLGKVSRNKTKKKMWVFAGLCRYTDRVERFKEIKVAWRVRPSFHYSVFVCLRFQITPIFLNRSHYSGLLRFRQEGLARKRRCSHYYDLYSAEYL